MVEVAVYEAKTRLSELLVAVEQGEEVTITRRGLAVARLVGVASAARAGSAAALQRRQVRDVFEALAAQRQDATLDIPLREAIEDGRD